MHCETTKQTTDSEKQLAKLCKRSVSSLKATSLVILGVSITLGVQAFTNHLPNMHGSATALGISASLWYAATRLFR